MSGIAMAVDTLDGLLTHRTAAPHQFMHKIPVAAQAGVLEDRAVSRFDLDRFMKIHERETFGMPETILGLGQILPHEIVR